IVARNRSLKRFSTYLPTTTLRIAELCHVPHRGSATGRSPDSALAANRCGCDPRCDRGSLAERAGARQPEPDQTIARTVSAAYRLRVGNYRVFYDVAEKEAVVISVLHKQETASFYGKDTS